jgi:hypothetical protein
MKTNVLNVDNKNDTITMTEYSGTGGSTIVATAAAVLYREGGEGAGEAKKKKLTTNCGMLT